MRAIRQRTAAAADLYSTFDQMDGHHPWQDRVPEGLILYPVRQLSGGKVSYFNFTLAKEMGLISKEHPEQMNKRLTEKILSTFCLRIINEFDQQKKTRFPAETIKPNLYMATRYLQIQHSDKSGRTSGDGRCIWNGQVVQEGKVWDVSSRGTGVTALAPGAVQAGQPLKSGNRDFGYGCGMAEIDELFGAAILAEIFHRNGIPTERMLAIIDLGKGVGIGVRAAPNLLRPAHFFSFLKQGKLEPLKRAVDCFIDRQLLNGSWPSLGKQDRYTFMLTEITRSFARFTAQLDRDYIFAWLEWDGDNVLADAGIIDYGSVRQFGLRHDQYRYDDIERFSTNLNEQRRKARDIVQTFVQLVDFIQTGKRKTWRHFDKSTWLKTFDRDFRTSLLERFLYQMGFVEHQRRLLLNKHRRDVEAFFDRHVEFERVKTYRKLHKVADGVHRPAIFNMRMALSLMAKHIRENNSKISPFVRSPEFFTWILSSQATRKDRRLTPRLSEKIQAWQELYIRLVKKVTTAETWDKTLQSMEQRASMINHDSRITGNALISVVDEILRYRRRGLSDAEIQKAIEGLIDAQTLNPEFKEIQKHGNAIKAPRKSRSSQPLLRNFLSVIHGYREDI